MSDWISRSTELHLVLRFFAFSIFYYLAVNTTYLVLLIAAFFSIRRHKRAVELIESLKLRSPAFAPPVSIIAPAYNESLTIVDSVRSFLLLTYPKYEIIVVNDGSLDSTLEKLIEAFQLDPARIPYDDKLSTTPIRGVYRSQLHENLVVIDKKNGGKADALNVGIGFASHDLFCAVDSDSVLEADALFHVAVPFIEDPRRTIAVGGTIRVANGCSIRHSRVESVGLPRNPIALIQVVEYIRAFLCGRVGWNSFNSTLVISGAFGMFNKQAVREAGGYLEGSIGEDMELIVRLHRLMRAKRKRSEYAIVYIPDPVCWTEAPSTLGTLYRQRNRWQRGLADTLSKNLSLLFNPRFGALGLFAMPYFFFVELLGPLVEVFSYLAIVTAWSLGILDQELLALFFLVGVLYGAMMSVASLVLEERYFARYPRLRDIALLMIVGVLESFGWRQLNAVWRLAGLFDFLRGKKGWGQMARIGFGRPK